MSQLPGLPSPPLEQQPRLQREEQEAFEAMVAARVEQQLSAQLQHFGKILLASRASGGSALEAAASLGRHQLLRQLLHIFQTSTAQQDIRNNVAAAALAAVTNGHPQCLQQLLHSCASATELLDARGAKNRTPLMIAAAQGDVTCLRLLLAHSPHTQVAALTSYGRNALMLAVINGQASCLPHLLTHSPHIQVAAATTLGFNALMMAACNGYASCLPPLLAHSPLTQVAAVDHERLNALMKAVASGHAACVQLLLFHAPDVQLAAADNTGRTAVSRAVHCGHHTCLQLLLQCTPPQQQQLDGALLDAGRRLSQLPTQPPTPATDQLSLGVERCIELLLAHGALPSGHVPEDVMASLRRISKELAARALVPNMANEAVVGLASAVREKRPSNEDAAGPSKRARPSP